MNTSIALHSDSPVIHRSHLLVDENMLGTIRKILLAHRPEAALSHIAEVLVPAMAAVCAIYLSDSHTLLRAAAFTVEDHAETALEVATLVYALREQSARVLQTGLPVLMSAESEGWHVGLAEGSGTRYSAICVPLRTRTRTLGVLNLVAHAPSRFYDSQDLELVEDLAYRIAMALDEEERSSTEGKVFAAQKLQSLGMLAGSIAHDLNNILSIAQGNVELAMMELDPAAAPLLSKYLATADTATRRASDLAWQMLAYSSKHGNANLAININALIEGMAELFHTAIRKQITLVYDLAEDLPLVAANVTQLRQVLMNLLINAGDAISVNRGQISVCTRVAAPDDPDLAGHTHDATMLYTMIEVTDTGCGMDAATLAMIFEPFFTTKQRGCGLGLAAVQDIIQAHHGLLCVTSVPGEGTTFRIFLPSANPSPRHPAPEQALPSYRGSGTVLVIDDEYAVRQTLRAMLEKLGFSVIEAATGLAGLRMLTPALRVIILDVLMPGLDGYETLSLIRRAMADVPVIMISGSDLNAADPAMGPAVRFVQKPLSFADLSAVLRGSLERDESR